MKRLGISVNSSKSKKVSKEIKEFISKHQITDHEQRKIYTLSENHTGFSGNVDYGILDDGTKIHYVDSGNDYRCEMEFVTIVGNRYDKLPEETFYKIKKVVLKNIQYDFIFLEDKHEELKKMNCNLYDLIKNEEKEWVKAFEQFIIDQKCTFEYVGSSFNSGVRIKKTENEIFYLFPKTKQWRLKGTNNLNLFSNLSDFFQKIKTPDKIEDIKLDFGKYKGQSLSDILKNDVSYFEYISKFNDLPYNLSKAIKEIKAKIASQ